MNNLEFFYRLLLTAYPPDHRQHYEDEMVAVLLESAPPGRRLPRLREASAIVASGLGTRFRSVSELHHGLRLAGVGAVGLVALFAGAALSLSAHQPIDFSGRLAAVWLAVLAVAIHATCATSTYRAVPAAVVSLAMMAAGAPMFGFRRSVLVTVAALLILAAAGPRSRRSVGRTAIVVGCGTGAILGSVIAADFDNVSFGGTERWMLTAQWEVLNGGMTNLTSLLSLGLVAAGLLIAAFRVRYLVAAVPMTVTTLAAGLFRPGGWLWGLVLFRTREQTVALIGLALVALGLTVTVPFSRRQSATG
jgi:hypothetical protein